MRRVALVVLLVLVGTVVLVSEDSVARRRRPNTTKIVAFGMNFGDDKLVASSGPVSIRALCEGNVSNPGNPNNDRLRIVGATDRAGSYLGSNDSHKNGEGGDHLDPSTPIADRVLAGAALTTGVDYVQRMFDGGAWVQGPDGHYVGLDASTALGLNTAGRDCTLRGAVVIVTRGS